MLCPYHKQQTVPLVLLVLMGLGVILTTFVNRGLHPILLTLFPGVAFTVFYLICILGKRRKPWHQPIWKASLWWSGIWLACFILGFVLPLATFGGPLSGLAYLALAPAAWADACGINPFIAVALHLLAWECSLDAGRNEILIES